MRKLRFSPTSRDLCIFGGAALLYGITGMYIAYHGAFFGDALSRLQAAQSVLFSRNPGLVDIGFVFTPLSTLGVMPLIALDPWISAMTDYALAGVIVSALFMAGTVLQVWRIGIDRRLPRGYLVVLTVLFATNPMVLLYGGSGMSEAPFLFAMAWGCRRLIRFVHTDDVHDLMAAGLAVALGFLARYDALAGAGMVLLGGIILTRSRRDSTKDTGSWRHTITDAVVFLFPSTIVVGAWFAESWLITGDLSAQVSSAYGNAAILESTGGQAHSAGDAIVRTLLLAPGLPVLLAVVIVLTHRRRSYEAWPPILLLGGVLGFQVFTAATGSAYGLLRFFLTAVLLITVLATLVPAQVGEILSLRPGRSPLDHGPVSRLVYPITTSTTVTALLLAGNVLTGAAMTSQRWAPQEYAYAAATPLVQHMGAEDLEGRREVLRTFSTERRLAKFIDGKNLPEGSVLLDTALGFPVVLFSHKPKTFVVPSDPDFITTLNNPAGHEVLYIVTVPSVGRATRDAVNRRYPTMYANGAGIATLDLEVENDGAGQPNFRLYRVMR